MPVLQLPKQVKRRVKTVKEYFINTRVYSVVGLQLVHAAKITFFEIW
ncbi:hypothetical protein FLA_0927 [Filimonas lacunae]|nr:hypothetical protein FLA_0927 [Filimonas lacunae]